MADGALFSEGDFKIDILIPVETSSREVPYKTYLCHLLAQKGFRCYLGSKAGIIGLFNSKKNFIYLDKGYHAGVSDKLYLQIKEREGIIISLDEEGGVDYADNSTLISRYSPELFNHAEVVFFWGKYQHDFISSRLGSKTQMEVSGHPRFDLLKPNFHYLYDDDSILLKKKYGNFVLVNTNMGFGNNHRGDDFVKENYGRRIGNIKDVIAFDKEKLEAYLNLVEDLSKELEMNIIIRPHPEENQVVYSNAFKNSRNVSVNSKGSVVPWLMAADTMIHPDCTTAIESLMIGKIPYSFLPNKYPKNLVTHLPVKASIICQSAQEIIKNIQLNDNISRVVRYADYSFLEDYFSFASDSSESIASIISAHFKSRTKDMGMSGVSPLFQVKYIFRQIKLRTLYPKMYQLFMNKFKHFSEDVQKYSKLLQGKDLTPTVKRQKLLSHLYCFSKVE